MTKAKVTPEGKLAGERIQRACELATGGAIDRTELAKRTKIKYSTLGNYEHGTRKLQIREARKIADATGVPAAYVLGLVDEQDMQLLRLPRETRMSLLQTITLIGQAGTALHENAPVVDPFAVAPAGAPKRAAPY